MFQRWMVWLVCLYLLSFGDFIYLAYGRRVELLHPKKTHLKITHGAREGKREKSKEESKRKRAIEREENRGFRRITLMTIGTLEIGCLRNCGCLCLMRTC